MTETVVVAGAVERPLGVYRGSGRRKKPGHRDTGDSLAAEAIMRLHARNVPTRLSTGAFIVHSGWEKWHGTEEQAQGVHGMASGAFPFLSKVPPTTFLKALAAAEITIGAALLAPVVSNRQAGACLTAFSAGLAAMYLRTPALHKPGSIWPTPMGIAVSKDAWMLGIGLSLLADRET